MVRSGPKRDRETRLIQGAREKGSRWPYQELTQVPLVEKTKACRLKPPKGNRQISPVTSGEGVPALRRAGRSDVGALTV
jgi:hypothetical protein